MADRRHNGSIFAHSGPRPPASEVIYPCACVVIVCPSSPTSDSSQDALTPSCHHIRPRQRSAPHIPRRSGRAHVEGGSSKPLLRCDSMSNPLPGRGVCESARCGGAKGPSAARKIRLDEPAGDSQRRWCSARGARTARGPERVHGASRRATPDKIMDRFAPVLTHARPQPSASVKSGPTSGSLSCCYIYDKTRRRFGTLRDARLPASYVR